MTPAYHSKVPDLVALCLNPSEMASLEQPEIRFALAYIAEHLRAELTPHTIAAEQHISRRTLEMRFRRYLGCTVENMITRLRVESAKQMLSQTSLPISAISVDAGFSSLSRMGHAFQTTLGMSATGFRQRAKSIPQAPTS